MEPWLLWQLVDSTFPSGGFVHSAGLEAACQGGAVDGDSLPAFLCVAVAQVGRGMGPLAMAVVREPGSFAEQNGLCEAMLSNHVANRASRAQGRALLASVERVFEVQMPIAERGSFLHHAPIFGLVCAQLGITDEEAARLFVFQCVRGWVSAAVRLGIVGPLEGQSMQAGLTGVCEEAVRAALTTPPGDACQTAPLLDLLQCTHDRLYSRLFQS